MKDKPEALYVRTVIKTHVKKIDCLLRACANLLFFHRQLLTFFSFRYVALINIVIFLFLSCLSMQRKKRQVKAFLSF